MKYMGSKNRHSRHLLPFMTSVNRTCFVEPFVGGANILDKISGPRIGADVDEDLICLWAAVSQGWLPPETFSEEEYAAIKTAPTSPLKGYAAFALSYGGKKFGGWCRDGAGVRNYVQEAYRNAVKQFPRLFGVEFIQSSFTDLAIPGGAVVYCDPPYKNTTKYSSKFDHAIFWDWVRDLSKTHKVYTSEYDAPDDFISVWAKPTTSSLTQDTGGKVAVEQLWVKRA